MSAIEKKAKRRIRRFIKTGKHQARVHQVNENTYEYKEKHHAKSLFFKRDKIGRLRETTNI
jgi:hypothetical protein